MNKILFFIFFNLGATVCGAQIYFNNVYDDSTYFGETTTNILLGDSGEFLLPSVYVINIEEPEQQFCGFTMRTLDAEGIENDRTPITEVENSFLYPNLSEAMIRTSDGSYVQASGYIDGYIFKLYTDFSIQWELSIDSVNNFYRPLELANGNFFVCGYNYDTNHINMFWISPEGVVLNQNYVNPYPQGNFYNILRAEELANGDLLLSGFYVAGFDGNQMILRLDETGNVIWKKKFDYDYNDWGTYAVVETNTTTTAVFGHIDYVLNPDDIWHDNFHGRLGTMQVDLLTGDTSDVILYEPELAGYWITDFTKTPDNGYAILGYAVSQEHTIFYSFITKLDENRQFQWHNTYLHELEEIDSTQFSYAWDFEVTADSGFVVAGHWDDLEMLGKQMPWVFKTDACGDLVWSNCGMTDVTDEIRDANKLTFNIYPNPSNTILNITSDREFESITVRNLVGQVVHQVQLNNHTLQSQVDLSTIASGVYLVEVIFGQGVVAAQRLVVE
jgi:hypothetical protein